MNESAAYGDSIAKRFGLDRAHSSQLVVVGAGASFAITRLSCGDAGLARSLPIPPESALIVVLQLQPLLKHELWLGQRFKPVEPWNTGAVSAVDLEEEPSARVSSASDLLHFYLPRSSLALAADHNCVHPIQDLNIPDGTIDSTIHQLGRLTLPALQNPDQTNVLFLSGLMTAFHAHLSQIYGGNRADQPSGHDGLTSAQLARAKEMIAANLPGNLALSDIASECQLPSNRFARAFKKATGMAPHQWLLVQRVEKAKLLLRMGRFSWPEVAVMSGFLDQSHLVRIFSSMVGTTPDKWQRQNTSREMDSPPKAEPN